MKRLLGVSDDGMATYHDYHDGVVYRSYEQDVEEALDYSKRIRNDEGRAKRGIKQDFQYVAHYPAIVVMKMLTEHGVNPITNPAEALAVAKVHFPACLTVNPSSVCKTAPERKLVIAK